MVTHLLTFLAGIAIGAGGQYLADRFTDQRRAKEERARRRAKFDEIERSMPDLIGDMRKDILEDKTGLQRNFWGVHIGAIYAPTSATLYYDPEQYPNFESKLTLLETAGFIVDIGHGNAPLYRMTEEFVDMLKAGR